MFKALGDAIKNLFDKRSAETRADHKAIMLFASDIEELGVNCIYEIIFDENLNVTEHTPFIRHFTQNFLNNSRTKVYDRKVHKALSDMMKDLGVRNKPQEFMNLHRTILQIVTYYNIDLKKEFSDLVTLEDLKVSHSFILSHMTLSYWYVRFLTALIGAYQTKGSKSSSTPNYLNEDIIKLVPVMTDYIIHLQKNKRAESDYGMQDKLNKIKQGVNLKLKVGDKDISEYANPGDIKTSNYDVIKMGFITSIFSVMIDSIATLGHLKYEKRIKMKEWMKTKQSILAMEMSGIDPNDPEYKKKQKIYDAYTSMISDL